MALKYLTKVTVELDGWDIDSLLIEANERLEEIAESWMRYDANSSDPPLSEGSVNFGKRAAEEVWYYWWDCAESLHKANQELTEILQNR